MTKEDQRQKVIEILKSNMELRSVYGRREYQHCVPESEIPFLADDILGCFSEVVSGWVSVEDRLPEIKTREESESVLVFIVHKRWKSRDIIKYNHKQGFWNTKYDGEKVTHWMPLPEKPNV